MLSIGKLGAGGARYYTEGLGAVDEYFSEAGARVGEWMGAGSELLGLAGPVDADELSHVLEGRGPSGGDRMSGSPSSVPGFDLCFRAPKSVSLLQALGEGEATAAVLSAHRVAVAEALGWMDREAVKVRRGHAGAETIPAAGLVAAGFEHFTSRAGDPHLHTHVVAANMAKGADGRWSALDGRAIYRQAKTAGYLYEAVLRAELTRRLGVEWGPVVNGIADLSGLSKQVIEEFSTRRAQIVAELAVQGASSPKAAQVAALATRPVKDRHADLASLRDEWQTRAVAAGMDLDGWQGLVGPGREPHRLDLPAVAGEVLGPDGLTASRSSFDSSDVLRAVAGLASEGASVAAIEAAQREVLGHGHAVAVGEGASGLRWSTVELVGLERQLLTMAERGRRAGVAVVDDRRLEALWRARPSLSTEQRAMIEGLCRSGDELQVVIGVAGAGKTWALGAAHEAWRSEGVRVIGTALSARAAQELAQGAGIHTSTIAKLTAELADPGRPGLPAGGVLVVDEAAMVSTRDLACLAGHARQAGAKLVLVGDDRQLPSIGAGGMFAALADRIGALELTENRRQALTWEQGALAAVRAGRSDIALAAYHAHDRRHHAPDHQELCARLVGDWAAARTSGTQSMMLATRRADVDQLNVLARQRLREQGVLGPDLVTIDGRAFAVGDAVICGRNDPTIGVINGSRGTVIGLSDRSGLTIEADGRRVELPARYLEAGHLAHSYATTIHKAQGATTERTFVLADEHLYREAGYVALSRGRHGNDIYTAEPAERADHEGHGPRGRSVDPLEAGLRHSRAQEAALQTPWLPGRQIGALEAERRRHLGHRDQSPDERQEAWRRFDEIGRLVSQRIQALGLWALEHPQPEHLRYLGSAPRQPDRRQEWARAAGEMSAYQERHGVAYQPEIELDHGPQRYDLEKVKRIVREVEPALDRSRELDLNRGHDLGLGL